jgi:hypothetical protein
MSSNKRSSPFLPTLPPPRDAYPELERNLFVRRALLSVLLTTP